MTNPLTSNLFSYKEKNGLNGFIRMKRQIWYFVLDIEFDLIHFRVLSCSMSKFLFKNMTDWWLNFKNSINFMWIIRLKTFFQFFFFLQRLTYFKFAMGHHWIKCIEKDHTLKYDRPVNRWMVHHLPKVLCLKRWLRNRRNRILPIENVYWCDCPLAKKWLLTYRALDTIFRNTTLFWCGADDYKMCLASN